MIWMGMGMTMTVSLEGTPERTEVYVYVQSSMCNLDYRFRYLERLSESGVQVRLR
jgi:hypothetical protein